MSEPMPMPDAVPPQPWPLARTCVIVGACWLALAWPWLSGVVTVPWDAKAHFQPQLQFLAASLARGESPFWTPFVFAGSPQIADPQSLIFSPIHALIAVLNPAPDFRWGDGALFGSLLLGALCFVLLFRDRGWHPAGAVVCALAFAFGAAASWRIQHVGQVLSLSWFAVTLLLLSRALERGSWRYGAAAGASAGLMVLGRDQVALIAVYVLAGLVLAAILATPQRLRAARASLGPLLAGCFGGLAVATVPILLTLFLAQDSNRPVIALVEAGKGSLHPASLFTGLVANLYGADGPLADFWGPPSPGWEARFGPLGLYLARNMGQLYLGLLPVLMLLSVGVLRGGLLRREIAATAVATLLVLLYALGRYTPAFELLFRLPGVDLFRRPADALFPLGALLAILGGYCTHLLMSEPEIRPTRGRILIVGLLLALAAAAMLWLASTSGKLALALRPLAIAGLCLVLVTGAVVAARGFALRGHATTAAIILAVAMTVDLGVNNGPNESTALPPATYEVLRADSPNETIALLKRETARTAGPDRRDRVELAGLGFHWPNASLVHGLDNTLGYNPLRLGLYSAATGAGDHVALPDQRGFSALMPSYRSLLADMLGLRFIATGVPVTEIDKRLAPGDLVQIARTPDAYVYENPRALPRVLLVTEAQEADFAGILASGRWPAGFDPRRTVLLEGPPPPLPTGPATQGTVAITGYRNTEVTLAVDAPRGGFVVLNDVWQPWWQVEVDGRPAPLLRANLLFRAVQVPPGRATVRLVFRPFRGLFAAIGQHLRRGGPPPV
ncbi:glycosyltransferase family 39 protein [Bosea sp. TWI1241]|uniref:glycosyltransferase family 39 protein n=1 Tax=Bosea sp. TWI1241 TaxID=3148904 RepID=UPI0032092F5F